MSLPGFLVAHKHEVFTLTAEHLWLVGISMLLAVAIGVPLGILLSRRPAWKSLVLGGSNIVGLALLPTHRAMIATNSALFTLDWDVDGLPLNG